MQTDYELIDSGNFEKLERFGAVILRRPALSAGWTPALAGASWQKVDASFKRGSDGKGQWQLRRKDLQQGWTVALGSNIRCHLKLTDFGHVGFFPEHMQAWEDISLSLTGLKQTPKVLHLFAYTGIGTLCCAGLGAEVVHVDASKTSVQWAKDNAALSKMEQSQIRWIVDDVRKFVQREIRRGSRFQGIILDPPTYGKGSSSQVWKIEEHLVPLLADLRQLVDPRKFFVLLSSHSPGHTPLGLANYLQQHFAATGARIKSYELLLTGNKKTLALPSGAAAFASLG